MKDKLWMVLFGGTVAVIFAAGASTATWGKKYLEFPTVWAQEKEVIKEQQEAEATEERQQTLLMREMLAGSKWDRCERAEDDVVCRTQQDSLRRAWFVQDSSAMEPDTTRVE